MEDDSKNAIQEEKENSFYTLNKYFPDLIYRSSIAFARENPCREEDTLWFLYLNDYIEAYLRSIGFNYLKFFKIDLKNDRYSGDEYLELSYIYNELGDLIFLSVVKGFCIKTIEKTIRVESKKLANTEFPCISKETYVVNHDIIITLKEPSND